MDRCENHLQDESLVTKVTLGGGNLHFVPGDISEQRTLPVLTQSVVDPATSLASLPGAFPHVEDTTGSSRFLDVEKKLLLLLCEGSLAMPANSKVLMEHVGRLMEGDVDLLLVEELLRKFAAFGLMSIRFSETVEGMYVSSLDFMKLRSYLESFSGLNKNKSEGGEVNKHGQRISASKASDIEDESDAAAGMTGGLHQQIHSGLMQQFPAHSWYCSYENSSNVSILYPAYRQGLLDDRPYPSVVIADPTATTASDTSETYTPADTSHISGHSYVTLPSSHRVDHSRMYLENCHGNIPSLCSSVTSDMKSARSISGRSFLVSEDPKAGLLASSAEAVPASLPLGGSRDARNGLAKPYLQAMEASVNVLAPPIVSETSSTSAFPYTSIPYSLTAPPPAPAVSAVAATSFPQGSDMPPFDAAGPNVYSWTSGSELYSVSAATTEADLTAKKVKARSGSGATKKKRVRRPEMWKKNLTKCKKLKGEEHVSRTGSVIPAKQVQDVDCSNCSFKCHENFSKELRRQLFEVFYSLASNESQKQFVCQNVQESATKVAASKKEGTAAENKRKFCRKYFLPDSDNTSKQVCSKFFCGTLAIGKTFINHALRHKQFGCYVGKEKRGKPHNKIPDLLLEPARQHISSLLVGTSGCSKGNSKKKCLEKGLNITKMYEMYKQECSTKNLLPVSLSMYRRIFHTEF